MMQTVLLRPIEKVLDLDPHAKGPNANGWLQTRCPAHEDTNRSLSFKAQDEGTENEGVAFYCFAGCTREAILAAYKLTEQEMHSRSSGNEKTARPSVPPLTVIDLAIDKRIHPNALMTWGLTEGQETFHKGDKAYTQKGVLIPYYTMDGTLYERRRLRTNIVAKMGTPWNEGTEEIIPYGLQKLEEARNAQRLIIVEGESDCWTLWFHKFPALGLPGANMVKCLQPEYVRGIDQIYIMQEPDAAGQKFPTEIKKRLDAIGYKGKVYAINLWNEHQAKDPNDLHKRDAKAFKFSFETAMLRAKSLHKERAKPKVYSMADLQDRILPETRWAIPDILPEGLTLLVGKPKLGKSWLLLAMLQAIASGGVALGNMPVEQGKVLYISLEDNEKRLQKRINTLLRNSKAAKDFLYTTDWTRLDEGGLEDIEQIIIDNPQLRLIGIDTWAKVKPKNKGGYQKQQYDEDYEALGPLQKLAGKYGVSIILVHHFRKMGGEDMIDQISGSTAIAGAVDNFLLLDRQRGETDAHLHVFGRDIEEEQDLLLTFDQEIATWKLKGHADDSTIAATPARQAILDVIVDYPEGISIKDLAKQLGKNEHTTRNNIIPLRNENKVVLKENKYRLVSSSSTSKASNTSSTSDLSERVQLATSNSHLPTSFPTSRLVTFDTPINKPVEPFQNGHSREATSATSVTSHSLETSLLLPEMVENYPQEVQEWHQAQGLKIEHSACTRKHYNASYLPWFNENIGAWENLCSQCYPGLRPSKGKYCEIKAAHLRNGNDRSGN